MGMTKKEQIGKKEIIKELGSKGYATYAKLFSLFELHFTADPSVIGYMVPQKGIITINENLLMEQISVVVRHEILHEYFKHYERAITYMGLEKSQSLHELTNIAGDYDISNKGYTDEDKQNIRSIQLNGQILSGLVTEDKHPNWVNLSFEDMIDELEKSYTPPKPQQQESPLSQEFVDMYNKIVELYDNDNYSDEELRELLNDVYNGKEIKL